MNKSKTPAILSGCGCVSLLIAMILFGAAWWMAPGSGDSEDRTPAVDMAHYANTREGRTGNLADHYVDFEFDYPKSWTVKTEAGGVNFVTVERAVDSKTWENLNVGYFQTAGSTQGNEALYGQLVAGLQNQFAQQFPGLRKVSEGKTKVGDYDAYEGLFHASLNVDGAPVEIYLRAIMLPTPDGTKGVSLLMMGTSFHPELKEPDDIGRKGEAPAILSSFRFD